jgi:hypothetical protein
MQTISDLVIAGAVRGAYGVDIDLTIALEPVLADDATPQLIAVYSTTVRADGDGRFTDRWAVTQDVAEQLRGWVMCTVVLQPRITGVQPFSKTVCWQRQTSAELITGLNALLASLSFELCPAAFPNGCVAPLATARTPRPSSAPNGPLNPR